MIKLLVNGFYRSGTTYLYEELKNSNHQLDIFYEPTSHSLSSFVFHKNGNLKMHSAYQYNNVGSAYKNLGIDLQLQLLRNSPFIGNIDLPSDIQVKKYLNLYNNFENDCVLQTNNLHFHLGFILDELSIPIVHVVRNPIDVWSSIMAVPYNRSSNWKNFIKSVLNQFNHNLPFNLSAEYQYIHKRFNPVDEDNRSWKSKLGLTPAFEIFVKVWIESNFQAVRHCVKHPNAMLLSFEELILSDYGLSQKKIEWLKAKQINFDKKIARKVKKSSSNKALSSKFSDLLNKTGLNDKYIFIQKNIHS